MDRRNSSIPSVEVVSERYHSRKTSVLHNGYETDLVHLGQLDAADFNKFLSRIATFFNEEGVNHHWLSKPPSLSPPNCAMFGWRLTSCNMLTCELCGSKLFAEVSAKLPAHIARKCLKEIERNLRSGHTKGCAFRFAPCPDHFKYISPTAAAALVAAFEQRLESLSVLKQDLPCVTMDEFDQLDKIKRDSDLKDTPTELVILALLGWEHHSTAYNKFVFIRCGFCFRKVCTMFYRKLTREEEGLVEEAQHKMCEESQASSPAGGTSGVSGDSDQPNSLERKRRGSKDILEARTIVQGGKKKRRPQDQLNPFFEHRSWCAWISKECRDSPLGWKVLLDLLVNHHKRLQDGRAINNMSHAQAIAAAENAVEKLRRKSDYWKEKLLPASRVGLEDANTNNENRGSQNNNNNNCTNNNNNNNNNNGADRSDASKNSCPTTTESEGKSPTGNNTSNHLKKSNPINEVIVAEKQQGSQVIIDDR
ncbi:nuclear-interacting partner of ALK-like isoform X2 [Varroa destructor]|uniref:Uncharacterized protein n=1 Tax=Varroa destructor TaxID=109461 RepID=A0A7M7JSX6_VARDE|nr:nuclear-interacting partner of ALK-like isoform X2 [Varroa destructor]